jgi:hypothetical protein
MGIDYAQEIMRQLAHGLADDVRPLPERLDGTFSPFANVVDDAEAGGYLPDDLLSRMNGLRRRLTRLDPVGGEGSFAATLGGMDEVEAHESRLRWST